MKRAWLRPNPAMKCRVGGSVFALCVGALTMAGCANSAASKLRPDPGTASAATGRDTCSEASPLIVDWRAEARGDLEVAMKEGIAVVEYSCARVRLIPDCWVDGDYAFVGTSPKSDVVRVRDADELSATLPEYAATVGARLSAEFKRGASLEVALAMVGKSMSTLRTVRPDQLKGRCEGATHFVRGTTVGAFALDTSSGAEIRAAAEVFGAVAGAGSESEKRVSSRDGELAACEASDASASGAPPRCAAPLRLQLVAIDDPLPAGISVAATPAGPKARSCAADDAQGCSTMCEGGDMEACFMLGTMYQRGTPVAADPARANILYKQACDGAVQDACVLLAISYLTGAEADQGIALLERACELNNPHGCRTLAFVWFEGNQPDPARAAPFARKACTLGDAEACEMLRSRGL